MAVKVFGYDVTISVVLYSLLAYVVLVRILRYRARDSQWQKVNPSRSRAALAAMTNQEAFEIQKNIAAQEFPFIYMKALQFALFRTYGIPTISKLLVATKQLSSSQHAGKRYSDTEVLIQEFIVNEPESQRTVDAISRMNFIHSLYQAKGLISNDDMLYTLSMFALEPARWIACHEWRELSDFEICALGVFWKAQGDAMNIDLSPLDQYKDSKVPEDGISWFNALKSWSVAYETRTMLPAATNKSTADETVAILLWDIPVALRPFGRHVVSSLMDDRLRTAMIYPSPPPWIQAFVLLSLRVRKYFLRFLALPRPYAFRVKSLDDAPDEHGRLHLRDYVAEPFYVRDTLYNRYGPLAWFKWAIGNPYPGKAFRPEGYKIPEVGPRSYEGKGVEEQRQGVERLRAMGRSGCPFKI